MGERHSACSRATLLHLDDEQPSPLACLRRLLRLDRAYQTGPSRSRARDRPAKSALRVSIFGPDALWARLKSASATEQNGLFTFRWARLGSNQRHLACETRPCTVPMTVSRCESP